MWRSETHSTRPSSVESSSGAHHDHPEGLRDEVSGRDVLRPDGLGLRPNREPVGGRTSPDMRRGSIRQSYRSIAAIDASWIAVIVLICVSTRSIVPLPNPCVFGCERKAITSPARVSSAAGLSTIEINISRRDRRASHSPLYGPRRRIYGGIAGISAMPSTLESQTARLPPSCEIAAAPELRVALASPGNPSNQTPWPQPARSRRDMANTPVLPESDRILRGLAWVLFLIAAFLALLVVVGVVISKM
jgi:hypothetical protein